ncbi:MAG: hypothetical protein IJP61_04280 [Treponema sp.]|nr:hypothetical protein [Treponema sp.]
MKHNKGSWLYATATFAQLDKSLLDKCFEAGYELLELAKVINYFANICKED